MTLTVTDDGSPQLSDTAEITITINDVNEKPEIENQTFDVDENSPADTEVENVEATDPEDDTLTFEIVEVEGVEIPFVIDEDSGMIAVAEGADLDYETTPSYTFEVEVTDDGSPQLANSAEITININNVNEQPVVNDQSFNVNENSEGGTEVGTVSAGDPDGDTLSYELYSGNFDIDSGGKITVADGADLDFETAPQHVLTVTVTDSGSPELSDSATVTIDINDVNEAPTIEDATFSIDEGAPFGTLVGTVTGTDPDTDDTLSYSITDGNDGAFAIDLGTGKITVDDSDMLDSTTTPSYTLTVKASDGQLDDTATVTINVLPKPVVNVTAVDPSALEDDPNDFGTFMFALAGGPIGRNVSVTYTMGGTATFNDDYTLSGSNSAITIEAGQPFAFLNVTAEPDAIPEGDEEVDLDLVDSPGEDYTVGSSGTATVVISEDAYPRFSVSDIEVTEGDAEETVNTVFTVSLEATSSQFPIQYPASVDFATFDGTATLEDDDYIAFSTTTLTFIGGQTSQQVTVTVKGDDIEENDEHFYAQLSNPSSNARLGNALAMATIENDDKVKVTTVDFVQDELGPRGGLLDKDGNPDGERDQVAGGHKTSTPAFGGGHRFFPGARIVLDDNDTPTSVDDIGNNSVFVRAELSGIDETNKDDYKVFFKTFDVDDPDSRAAIDPNGNHGFDNRGRLSEANFSIPGESQSGADGGFHGNLQGWRPFGPLGSLGWEAPGNRQLTWSVIQKDGETGGYYSEAILLTSFAPGDNFRVAAIAAKTQPAEIGALDNTSSETDVPYKDNDSPSEDLDDFREADGKLTPQLTVWRKLHLEQDRMATVTDADKRAGAVTAAVRATTDDGSDIPWVTRVTVDVAMTPDEFAGGIFRYKGKNYHVLSNTASTVDILLLVPATIVVQSAPENATIYQDDYSTSDNPNGTNQMDLLLLEASDPDGDGQFTVNAANAQAMTLNQLQGGLIRDRVVEPDDTVTYEMYDIIGNDEEGKITGKKLDASQPLPDRTATIFTALTDDVPTPRVDPSEFVSTDESPGLYAMVQASTDRKENRFADAYLEPEWHDLDAFDSINGNDDSFVDVFSHFNTSAYSRDWRGIWPARQSLAFESDLFWVVYNTTAYEGFPTRDNDGDSNYLYGVALTRGTSWHSSLVFLETARDVYYTDQLYDKGTTNLTIENFYARIVVHELAHQLLEDFPGREEDPDEDGGTGHRDQSPNLISFNSAVGVPDFHFYLDPRDVAYVRALRNTNR